MSHGEGHGEGHGESAAITFPEKAGTVILLALAIAVGLYPRLLLDWIVPSFSSPLFDGLRKGAGL